MRFLFNPRFPNVEIRNDPCNGQTVRAGDVCTIESAAFRDYVLEHVEGVNGKPPLMPLDAAPAPRREAPAAPAPRDAPAAGVDSAHTAPAAAPTDDTQRALAEERLGALAPPGERVHPAKLAAVARRLPGGEGVRRAEEVRAVIERALAADPAAVLAAIDDLKHDA